MNKVSIRPNYCRLLLNWVACFQFLNYNEIKSIESQHGLHILVNSIFHKCMIENSEE